MQNYNEMSDFEINRRVAESLGFGTDNGYGFIDSENNVVCYERVENGDGNFFDTEVRVNYCNNPSDAWSAIEDILKLGSVSLDGKGAVFFPNNASLSVIHVEGEPLRAAMIAFLMMRDSGHGN